MSDRQGNESNAPGPDDSPPDKSQQTRATWIGIGIALGAGLGTTFGIVADNVALGLGVGVPAGVIFGIVVGTAESRSRD